MRHRYRTVSLVVIFAFAASGPALAREIFINNCVGDDTANGTAAAPWRTIAKAIDMVQPGDVIHLLPEGAIYREQISLIDTGGFTIEGHGCTVSGADPLPSDPAAWQRISQGLHRIQLDRTREDRHILVVDGRAQRMGRDKYSIGRIGQIEQSEGWDVAKARLVAQYPKPEDLRDGEFAWEPTDRDTGFLYVKGSLDNLEWATRTEGVYTFGRVHDVTIGDLHVRHVLNDGFNLHGDTQNMRLLNVSGNECFDNGVSPHGACSMVVEDSEFLRNGLAVGHGHVTKTRFTRCVIGESLGWELMIIGGEHVLEDCTIRTSGQRAVRLIFSTPKQPYVLKEIELAGKQPHVQPRYVMRRCTIEGRDGQPASFTVERGANLTLDRCTLTHIDVEIDPAATVDVIDSTLDGAELVVTSPPAP